MALCGFLIPTDSVDFCVALIAAQLIINLPLLFVLETIRFFLIFFYFILAIETSKPINFFLFCQTQQNIKYPSKYRFAARISTGCEHMFIKSVF